ncbi:GNAT family N-acetyltransferase [Micromonospora sp. NPDC051300]|uniref:GNAT family N-acetyltransferase n=1 Tax=Micromonospora sp. NPDC051300 TaxID=3364286 RepID=UPI0037BD71B7
MDEVKLTAPGLRLRAWHDDDAPAVLAALADPAIDRWNGQGVTDLARALDWVQWRADRSSGTRLSLAVTDDAGALLGAVSLNEIRGGNASIGYWTVAEARGRGVALRAVTVLTAWGFREHGLHRIELCTRWPTLPRAASPSAPAMPWRAPCASRTSTATATDTTNTYTPA